MAPENHRPTAQWSRKAFAQELARDAQLLPVKAMTFHKAAMLTMDVTAGLRAAGDALHLAYAMQAKTAGMVTLDAVLAKNSNIVAKADALLRPQSNTGPLIHAISPWRG